VFESEVGPWNCSVQIVDGEAAICSAADDQESLGPKMSSDSLQDARPMLWGHEVHDVPDDEGAVEPLGLAEGSEIQPGQIRNHPGCSGVVFARRCDKQGIDVDTEHVVW
jgi:hypothetical protein